MAGFADFIMGRGALKKAEKGGDQKEAPKSAPYSPSELLRRNEEAAAQERKRKASDKSKAGPKAKKLSDQLMRY